MIVTALLAGSLFPALSAPWVPAGPAAPDRNYYVYACAESEDEVTIVQYGPAGAGIVKVIEVGSFPTEIEGPHGINMSPDGLYWYVTLAHGNPFGSVHK